MAHARRQACAVLLAFACATAAAEPPPPDAQARTAAYFDRIVGNAPALRLFLQAMPKGAYLHSHIGGSVYAEDWLRWAAEQGLCIETERAYIVAPPCSAPARVPARDLAANPTLYARAVDALSTRGFERGGAAASVPGYERFFAAFEGFRAAAEGNSGRALAAVRDSAARDRVAYVEVMAKPRTAQPLLAAADADDAIDFAAAFTQIAPLLPGALAQGRAEFDRYESEIATLGRCGTATPAPSCAVELGYQAAARRNQPPARVFAELAFAFALVQADRRFVGVNIAGAEHDPISLRDYALHMRMLAFFHAKYPQVPMSLHAGELELGLVAPPDLRFHIHDAVAVAGARRIGHGVDIGYETDAAALLQRMARERIAVEINLSSNAVILGVEGTRHPLALYRQAGVPIVLSTDDQGILRSDLTHEYQRAAEQHGLRYLDLKRIARDSLQYAFLAGASLWDSEAGGARVAACAASIDIPSSACMRFLNANPKARLQWRLEQDLAAFERSPR